MNTMYLAAAVKFYDNFPASSAKNKFIHRLTTIYERKPLPLAAVFLYLLSTAFILHKTCLFLLSFPSRRTWIEIPLWSQ